MKYLCDACSRLVEAGNFAVQDDRLVLVCPVCGERSVGGTPPAPGPERAPAPVLALARPPRPPEGPLCPKCGAPRPAERDSCAKCGLVFALFKPENLALPDEVEALWASVEAGWDEPARHEAFLDACGRAALLPEAARRYRIAAERNPADPIAARHRDELVSKLMALSLPGMGLSKTEKRPEKMSPVAAFAVLLVFGSLLFALIYFFLMSPGPQGF